MLIEHHWAVPLRDAIARANGHRISDGFISPLDLVEIGLLSAEEAQELHVAETGHRPPDAATAYPTIGAAHVRIPQSRAPHFAAGRAAPTNVPTGRARATTGPSARVSVANAGWRSGRTGSLGSLFGPFPG